MAPISLEVWRLLLLNVLTQDGNGSTTATRSKVRWRPKNVFPISALHVWSLKPEESAGNTFKAVDQRRYRMLGWVVHQQMDVVYFAVHLDQLGLEVLANLAEYKFEPMDRIGVEYLFPVFGDEDQMDMKLKDTVSTVSNIA